MKKSLPHCPSCSRLTLVNERKYLRILGLGVFIVLTVFIITIPVAPIGLAACLILAQMKDKDALICTHCKHEVTNIIEV